MQRRRNYAIREATIQKYFVALQKLKTILDYGGQVSLSKFANKHGLKAYFADEVVKWGLVKKIQIEGKPLKYEWNTIDPNTKMALELIKRCNSKAYESRDRIKKQKELEKLELAKKEAIIEEVKSIEVIEEQIEKGKEPIGDLKQIATQIDDDYKKEYPKKIDLIKNNVDVEKYEEPIIKKSNKSFLWGIWKHETITIFKI